MKKTIKELVEEAGVVLVPIGDGIYRGSSPFKVSVNHTPSFTVYNLTNSWFDYGESIGGDAASFIARLEGISYKAAKEKLEGNTDVLQEITETLDGLSVKDAIDFSDQTNMSLSKYCRDLFYKYPNKETEIMNFLKHLDTELKNPINQSKMAELIKASRELEK